MAHYRGDAAWAVLRAPNMALDVATARRAVKHLAEEHGFKLDLAMTV